MHGVRCSPNDESGGPEMVGLAVHAHERLMRVLAERPDEGRIGNIFSNVGKVCVEKERDLGRGSFQGCKAACGHDEGTCKGAVLGEVSNDILECTAAWLPLMLVCAYLARDGNKGGLFHGPDVQVVRLDLPRACSIQTRLARLDLEVTPKRIHVLLLVIDAGHSHHMVADGGARAISTEQNIEADLCGLREPISVFHPGFAPVKVNTRELVVEK